MSGKSKKGGIWVDEDDVICTLTASLSSSSSSSSTTDLCKNSPTSNDDNVVVVANDQRRQQPKQPKQTNTIQCNVISGIRGRLIELNHRLLPSSSNSSDKIDFNWITRKVRCFLLKE